MFVPSVWEIFIQCSLTMTFSFYFTPWLCLPFPQFPFSELPSLLIVRPPLSLYLYLTSSLNLPYTPFLCPPLS